MERKFRNYYKIGLKNSYNTLYKRKINIFKYYVCLFIYIISIPLFILKPVVNMGIFKLGSQVNEDNDIEVTNLVKSSDNPKNYFTCLFASIMKILIILGVVLGLAFIGGILALIGLAIMKLGSSNNYIAPILFASPAILAILCFIIYVPIRLAEMGYIVNSNNDINASNALNISFISFKKQGKMNKFLIILVNCSIKVLYLAIFGTIAALPIIVKNNNTNLAITLLLSVLFIIPFIIFAPLFTLSTISSLTMLNDDVVSDTLTDIVKATNVKFNYISKDGDLTEDEKLEYLFDNAKDYKPTMSDLRLLDSLAVVNEDGKTIDSENKEPKKKKEKAVKEKKIKENKEVKKAEETPIDVSNIEKVETTELEYKEDPSKDIDVDDIESTPTTELTAKEEKALLKQKAKEEKKAKKAKKQEEKETPSTGVVEEEKPTDEVVEKVEETPVKEEIVEEKQEEPTEAPSTENNDVEEVLEETTEELIDEPEEVKEDVIEESIEPLEEEKVDESIEETKEESTEPIEEIKEEPEIVEPIEEPTIENEETKEEKETIEETTDSVEEVTPIEQPTEEKVDEPVEEQNEVVEEKVEEEPITEATNDNTEEQADDAFDFDLFGETEEQKNEEEDVLSQMEDFLKKGGND